MVVVHSDCAVVEVPREWDPVVQRVVDGLCRSAAVSDEPPLELEPVLELLPQRLGELLAQRRIASSANGLVPSRANSSYRRRA
jgi:hypothetical protein